jgi:hypothetical protein
MEEFENNKGFSIIAVPTVKTKPYVLPPFLPQNSLLIAASQNSGKTCLICNCLARKKFKYMEHYDKVYIFSPTINYDDNWNVIKNHEKVETCDNYDEDKIEEILDFNEQSMEQEKEEKNDKDIKKKDKHKCDRVLIILDDCTQDLPLGASKTILERLYFRSRHILVTTWISVQQYKKCIRAIRINTESYIFFKMNENELNTVTDELAQEDKKDFKKIFKYCTNEKYNFMVIHTKNNYNKRYMHNFTSYVKLK